MASDGTSFENIDFITNRDWEKQYESTLTDNFRIPQYQLLLDINKDKKLTERHIPTIKNLLKEDESIGPRVIDTDTPPIIYVPSFDNKQHTLEYMFPGLVVNFNEKLNTNETIVKGLRSRVPNTNLDDDVIKSIDMPEIKDLQESAETQAEELRNKEIANPIDYYTQILNKFETISKSEILTDIIHFQMHEMSFFNRVIAACDKYSELDQVLDYFTTKNSHYEKTMYELLTTPFFIGILDTPCGRSEDFSMKNYDQIPTHKNGNPVSSSDISIFELYSIFTPDKNSTCELKFPNILITINSIKKTTPAKFTNIHNLFGNNELDEIHRRYKIYNDAPIPIKRVIMKMLLDKVQDMTTTIKRNVTIKNKQLRSELLSPIYAIDSMLNHATHGILEYLNPYQMYELKQKSLKKKKQASTHSPLSTKFTTQLDIIRRLKNELIRLLCRIVIFNKVLVPMGLSYEQEGESKQLLTKEMVTDLGEGCVELIPNTLKEHSEVFKGELDKALNEDIQSFEISKAYMNEDQASEIMTIIGNEIVKDETHITRVIPDDFLNKYISVVFHINNHDGNHAMFKQLKNYFSEFVHGVADSSYSVFESGLLNMIDEKFRNNNNVSKNDDFKNLLPSNFEGMNYIVTILRAFRVMQGTAPYGKNIMTPQTQLALGNICAYMNKLNVIEGLNKGKNDFAMTQSKQTEFCEFKETSGSRRTKRFYTKHRSDETSISAESEIRQELIDINNLLSPGVESLSNPYILHEFQLKDVDTDFYKTLIKNYANILFHDVISKESHGGFDGLPLLYPNMIRPIDLGYNNVESKSEDHQRDVRESLMKGGDKRTAVEELVKKGLYDPDSSLRKGQGKAVYAKPIGFVQDKKDMTYEEIKTIEGRKEEKYKDFLESLTEKAKPTDFKTSDINVDKPTNPQTKSTESVTAEVDEEELRKIVETIKQTDTKLTPTYRKIEENIVFMKKLDTQIDGQTKDSNSQIKNKRKFVELLKATATLFNTAQPLAITAYHSAETAYNIIQNLSPTDIPAISHTSMTYLLSVIENEMIKQLFTNGSELMQTLNSFSDKYKDFDESSATIQNRDIEKSIKETEASVHKKLRRPRPTPYTK